MANAMMSKVVRLYESSMTQRREFMKACSKIKKRQSHSLAAVFLIKPPSVALEKFGEWVCACRSSSAFFRRSAARWLHQHPTQKNNCRAAISQHFLPILPPFAATKAVLTKKYRLYYSEKCRSCQLKRIWY